MSAYLERLRAKRGGGATARTDTTHPEKPHDSPTQPTEPPVIAPGVGSGGSGSALPAHIPPEVVLFWADQHQPTIARTYRHEQGHPINGPVLMGQLTALWWRWAVATWAGWTPAERAEMERRSDALEASGKTPHESQVTAFLEVGDAVKGHVLGPQRAQRRVV